MTKKYKIDLNLLLENLDNGNYQFYDSLDKEQQAAFEPWLAMRWASSSKKHPEHHLIFVNELVNKDFNTLRHHPKLQWMLLAMAGVGKHTRYDHKFVPPPRGNKKDKLTEMISAIYPWMNDDEIALFVVKNEKEEVRALLEGYGYDEKDIKKVM